MVQGGLKKVQGGLEPPLAPHFPRLWFGVNFCMSYDFSLTSQSCLLWFGVSFACHVIFLLVSF